MTTRVVWKDDEKQALAERAALLMFKGEAGSQVQAINAAQDILHESRKRDIATTGGKSMAWFRTLLVQELAKLRQQAGEQEAQAAADEAAKAAAAMVKAAQKATAEALVSKDAEHAKAAAQAAAMQLSPNKLPCIICGPTRQEPTSFHLRSALVDELASILIEAVFKAIGSTHLGEQFARITDTSRSRGMTQLRSTLAGLA